MSQRKRPIIQKMNAAGEEYLEKENKFRRGGCMPEDRLHMETMKNFWTCMKTAFEEEHQDQKKNPCVRKKIPKNIWAKTFDFTCDTCGKKMTNTNQTNVSRHLQKH